MFTLLSTLFRCSWNFSIRLLSKMFLRENLLNGFVIKINWITIFLLKLAWKYNLNFFTTIGVKIYFPLNCPAPDFVQVTVQFNCRYVFILWTTDKNEVSSAKSLKSLSYPNSILVHEECCLFKTTLSEV